MSFHTPLLLLLLLVPLGFFVRSLAKADDPLKNVMTKAIRKKLFVSEQMLSGSTKYYLFLLIVGLFIIALARPIKVLPFLEVSQNRPSVILAIDRSRSMQKTDIFPSREALANAKAQSFIEKATGYNIGLIFYANDAYMLYPLSQENTLLLSLLKDANITQKFAPNSNLFAALEASGFLLKNHQNKHVVLLSDGGADVAREDELAYLVSQNIMLSTLAIDPKPNHAMQTLSSKSLGLYQPFSWSESDVLKLITHINSAKKTSEKIEHDIPQYQEYFSYPLALALLLLILFFLPLKKHTLLMLFLFYLQPSPLQAGAFDFWHTYQAQKASEENNYSQAIKEYQETTLSPTIEYNLAYAFYKNTQYNRAIKHYQKALGEGKEMDAKIYYNIGTAYARQNKLQFAKESYEKSFALYPTKITQENLHLVTLALKKQRKNLHKKTKKLKFKSVGENPFSQNSAFTNYAIKLHKFVPSEEEQWFQKIAKQNAPTYLQKIKTTKRSIDANISW